MSILIKYIAPIALLTYFYYSYTNMEDEIKLLKQKNTTLKQNLEVEKKQCEEKLKVKDVVVKWKTKKVYIEKQVKKDTNEEAESNTKPANRFYLD